MAESNKTIIKIFSFHDAIPKKDTWYDYYDDIFISVLPTLNIKPHVRRKNLLDNSNKVDNSMCEWHQTWQYINIEGKYGGEINGGKTYEVCIKHNNETHRIDSLVKNIAIEFQHTLSVSLVEMNSRYVAHKACGFFPYLILDFTQNTFAELFTTNSDYNEEQKNEIRKLARKVAKWFDSEYYKNDKLFIDLKDCIIRFTSSFLSSYTRYDKQEFLDGLLTLEDKYIIKKSQDHNTRQANYKIELEKKIEYKKYQEAENKRQNEYDKETSEDYKYFRKCFNDETIKPLIENYISDEYYYMDETEKDNGYYKKSHLYRSLDNDVIIIYTTIQKVEVFFDNRGYKKNNFKYLFAEITVNLNNNSYNWRNQYGKTTLLNQ